MIKYNALLHGTPSSWDVQRKRYVGGGGSQSSENSATKAQGRMLDYNLGKLRQTDTLRDPYMAEGLQGAMGAYDKYGDQSYIDRQVGQANMDAQRAIGQGRATMGRDMARYGLNPASGRYGSMVNQGAIQGAAMQAGAMNQTRNRLEDQATTAATNKWKLLNDMNTESMNQGQQIASGYGQQGSTMAQNAQTTAQANAGLGSTAMAAADMYMKYNPTGFFAADGGLVGRDRYMTRGMENVGPNAGIATPPPPSPMQQGVQAAQMGQRGQRLYGGLQSGMARNASIDAAKSALATGAQTGTMATGLTAGGEQAAALLAQEAGMGAAGAAGAAEGAGALAAGTQAALATGVEGAALANSWNPAGWALGAGLLAGKIFGLFADGGEVDPGDVAETMLARANIYQAIFDEPYQGLPEQDAKVAELVQQQMAEAQAAGAMQEPTAPETGGLRRGGAVRGPGTETSDSIPARLSKGEYVVNADSVKMPGVKKKLEKINKKGLQKRYGKGYADGGVIDWVREKVTGEKQPSVEKLKEVDRKALGSGMAGKAADALKSRDAQIAAEMKRQGLKDGGMVKKARC